MNTPSSPAMQDHHTALAPSPEPKTPSRWFSRRRTALTLAALFCLTAGPLLGQGDVKATGVTRSGPNITLSLASTPTIPSTGLAASFRLESSPTMGAGTWTPLAATVTSLGSGLFTATFTQPGGAVGFFRGIGITGTPGVDSDGDGLSDAFELSIGSNPFAFDSVGDGYSDGERFLYGTPPFNSTTNRLSNVHPTFLNTKPTVNFALADSTATEGTSPQQVQITFDRTYTGTVNYAINALSTAVVGTDYTLGGSPTATTGSVSVNGTSASIPISLVDDANASGLRAIIIDLKVNGEAYFVGGRSAHVVVLKDDDAWWTGVLIPNSGESTSRVFRVKIAHQGGTTTAVFGAGAGNDGLDVPVVTAGGGAPDISTTSISTSIIPAGSWPASGVVDSAAQFTADSGNLLIPPVPTSIFNQVLRRRLHLNAQPSLDAAGHPHSLLPGVKYVGEYTETLIGGPISLAGAVATESTNLFGSYPASNALDGDVNSFSHTATGDTAPTWTLTLPVATPVSGIFLYNRTQGWKERLRNITIRVFSDAAGTMEVFNSGVLNPNNVLNGPATLSVSPGDVTARVISVYRGLTDNPVGDDGALSLAEVKLFGPSVSPTVTGGFVLLREIQKARQVVSPLVP